MAYVPPSLKIYQEFAPQLVGNLRPLYACIVAPQYALHRFEVEDEQALLGAYNAPVGNVFSSWPNRETGSTIDTATSAVWVKDAILKYYNYSITGTGTGPTDWDGLITSDGNQVRSDSLVFKTANSVNRSTVFGDRDVTIGDYVKVQKGATIVESRIAGLVADVVDAVIDAAAASPTNKTTTTETATVVDHITSPNFTVTASAAAYAGLVAGKPSEVYTCVVTDTDGTQEGTTIAILSASGTDDVASQVLAATGVPMALGTRGAAMTMTNTFDGFSSSSQTESNSSQSDSNSSMSSSGQPFLTIGDSWVVTIAQDYTPAIPTSGGTYAGTKDTVYLAKVTTGGTVGSGTVKFAITTDNGFDTGVEVQVTAAGTYSIGNYGVTLTFTGGAQYCTGDVFIAEVTATGAGAYRTIVLADNLTGWSNTDVFAVTLGIIETIELDVFNWAATASSITVIPSARHTASYLGPEAQFYILGGTLYIDYRELIQDNTRLVGFIQDITEVETILGPATTENPLALMVYTALSESADTGVYYIGVSADTVAAYVTALEELEETAELYSIVPFNTSAAVQSAVMAHIDAMALPGVAQFRVLWAGIDTPQTDAFYTVLASGNDIKATVAGTALTATGALFITNGVRAGDTVRINYHTDPKGAVIYDEAVIAAVNTQSTLTLESSLTIGYPVKMEVWRTATQAEYAANIAARAESLKSRRAYAVWADNPVVGAYAAVSKAYAAAAGAGLRSGMAPHAPLTNVNFSYLKVDPMVGFSATRMNLMAGKGVWLIVSDINLNVYTRHQVSTDPTDINTREQTITTNLDHICRDYKLNLNDLYGKGNVSPGMLELIRIRVHGITTMITGRNYPAQIGPQLLDLDIVRLEQDPVNRDQVWLEIEPSLPYPMNQLTVKFRVI